jgi:hypothetical protein
MSIDAFAIGFDHRDRARLHDLWDGVLERERWSDGPLTVAFEDAWSAWNGLPAVAVSSWTGAALAALQYFDVRGKSVLCPSNTFMATPLAIEAAGGRVAFVDCNREDLCMSSADLERKVAARRPHAVVLVHIVTWKNEAARELLDPVHPNRLRFPDGMLSGLYKYVVFDEIERSTGRVYDEPCHRVMGHAVDLPNTDWVATSHWCVPLYYRPARTAQLAGISG